MAATARQRAEAKLEKQIRQARKDPAAFVEFALRAQGTGAVVKNAKFHQEWHDILSTHPNVVLLSAVEHGKSSQIAVGRVIWELGNNPNLRIAILSSSSEQAQKPLRQIKTQIEENPRVRMVFPDLVPSSRYEDPWTQSDITVERSTIASDPSIQARGVYGPIVGSRLDLIVLDDVLDFDNSRTDAMRKKLLEWFDTTVFTRAVEGARIWVIGTPWHNEDLLATLKARPMFFSRTYPAIANDNDDPSVWKPLWPEQWSTQRLQTRQKNTPEHTFARKWLCKVRADALARFKEQWLQFMVLKGKGMAPWAEAPKLANGTRLPCFTGVDLGVGEGDNDALTCIFTIALDQRMRRIVCEIQSGHWTSPEIIDRLASVYSRFESHIMVESNGAQRFLIQHVNGRFPVGAFHTGSNKWDDEFGVESLAVEMRNALWVLPSGSSGENVHPEGMAWLRELRYFDPTVHTGDRLMASWLATEAARSFSTPRSGNLDTQSR